MKNKAIKILGFGVVVLMILMSLVPACSAMLYLGPYEIRVNEGMDLDEFTDTDGDGVTDMQEIADNLALEESLTFVCSGCVPPSLNAIILALNSPLNDRLGGVFSIVCPANHTLTGLFTNGTFICTDLADFFP